MALFSNECIHCGSKEHASSDCPHGLFSSKCIHCGSVDHASDDCPHGLFSSKCIHCGSVDHASDDCPHGLFSSKCIHCGSIDHASDDCPHGLFSSKCIHCGSINHASDDCPHGLFSGSSSSQNAKRSYSSSSSDSSNNDEGNCLGQLIGYGLLVAAAIWFVFAVAVPLIVINVATITLIAGLMKKSWNKVLFSGSVLGSIILVFDYNNGWATKALVENVSFFKGSISFFFYLNIAAGLVAGYFLIRNYLNQKNPPVENEGEFSKRNLIVMGCLVLIGGLTIGGQKYFDNRMPREIPLVGYSVPSTPVQVQPTTNTAAHDLEERNRAMENAMAQSELAASSTGTVQTKQGSNLRLRAQPSEQAPVIASIPNGTTVAILGYSDHFEEINGEKGKWCNIIFNGKTGWAWGGFIKNNINNSSADNSIPDKEQKLSPPESDIHPIKSNTFLLTNSRGNYRFNSKGINIKLIGFEIKPDYFQILFEISAAGENKDLLIYAQKSYNDLGRIVDNRLYITDNFGNRYTSINGFEGGNQEEFNSHNNQINLSPSETVEIFAKFPPIKEGVSEISFISPRLPGHQGGWQFTGIDLKKVPLDK